MLTGGERSDMPGFDAVFDQLPADHALADARREKGYDSHHIRHRGKDKGLKPVIPPKRKRKEWPHGLKTPSDREQPY